MSEEDLFFEGTFMGKRKKRSYRKDATASINFLVDTLDSMYPGVLEARLFDDPSDKNWLIVCAYHLDSGEILSSWILDKGGQSIPPLFTYDAIRSAVWAGWDIVRKGRNAR